MFSVDNFYSYLNQLLKDNNKTVVFKSFDIHGSRSLSDIIAPTFPVDSLQPIRLNGQIVMLDQEPIEMSYYDDWINFDPATWTETFEYFETQGLYKHLSPHEFVFRHFAGVYNPILCHSELNSREVELFRNNHFHTVHYFYHGLIARDWFRHWKHYSMKRGTESKRLGMYCRDASGSRAYRLDLLHRLIPYKDDLYYRLQDPIYAIDPQLNMHYQANDVEYNSHSSAIIVPEDCQLFDIQIVPETLFETNKTHLTEKIFKPIVMKQPFIIVGCPNSLMYLKRYGFKTFDELWDESYDLMSDPQDRMDAILKVVDAITDMDAKSYNQMMDKAQSIIEYNQKHFFSDEFETLMLNELHTNLDAAFKSRDEEYYAMPGGTWFMYMDKLHKAGLDITDFNRLRNDSIIEYLLEHDPEMGRELKNRFGYLTKNYNQCDN